MRGERLRRLRLTWAQGAYVGVVAVAAAMGFVIEAPQPILLAALLTLPASVMSVPAYYALYGLLAQIPGANPRSGSGFSYSTGPGSPEAVVESGGLAPWFELTTGLLGVLLLAFGALANILFLRAVRSQSPRRRPTA